MDEDASPCVVLMRDRRRSPSRPLVIFSAFLLLASVAQSESRDAASSVVWLDAYADLLKRHTQAVDSEVGTRVNYAAIAEDEAWVDLMDQMATLGPKADWDRNEKLAFWINVYNLLAINLVVTHYPVESIKDIGSFFRPVWYRTAGVVGGRAYSLDQIEHKILRPMGDPRIHGAIVCASISCPSLRREPYRADMLSDQLDASLRDWLARPDKGLAVDRVHSTVRLSRVFDWFKSDFDAEGGVLQFVSQYAPSHEQSWIVENRERVDIRYLKYDWNLND